MTAARTLSLLMLGALTLTNFACGGSQPSNPLPTPTPSPSPTPSPTPSPSPVVCTQLSEQACAATADCAPQYVTETCACAPCEGPACEPCTCEPTRVYVGCLDRDPCEGLNQPSCLADSRCEAIFRVPGCDRECPPGDPTCLGCGQPQYAGCQSKTTPECPATCDIFCPYGHQYDEDGCELCACNPPPPNGCEALDEPTCAATPGCRVERGGEPCACPACIPGGECPPCECPGELRAPPPADGGATDPAPDGGVSDGGDVDAGPGPSFRCVAIDACGGLDERTCNGTPGCMPVYSASTGGGSSGGGGAAPCECPTPDGCNCTGDALPPRRPSGYAGCVAAPSDPCSKLSENECLLDHDLCEPRYVTACPIPPPAGEDAGAPIPPECTTTYAGCFSTGTPGACTSDAECPNAYCELTELCDRTGTCTVTGQCRTPNCDDGPAVCDALPPACPVGQTAAARNRCWTCVDARTCLEPSGVDCMDDTACPNGFCAFSTDARPGPTDPVPPPPPPGGQCVFPTCGDGSQLMCRRAMPICPAGQTPEIVNGCYGDCVDARTCSTNGPEDRCVSDADCMNGYCGLAGSGTSPGGGGGAAPPVPAPMACIYPTCPGDGGSVICLLAPVCPVGQAPAPLAGCWTCVDARTCQ
jgi:hypothetical protein